MASFLGSLAAILAIVGIMAVMIAILSIWRGFVLVKLWTWFVVPTFGLPALTMAPAIGFSLLVGFLVYQYSAADSAAETNNKNVAFVGVIYPLIVLVIGYVVHLCM